ncbi:MAG TPA: autotransporter outer membrane beta-barrel domain-containing protein [Pseudomonas sp.]|nr:autotransporter outer membrane beta-barrel domain-containing protein [Pseudomonas sp.]
MATQVRMSGRHIFRLAPLAILIPLALHGNPATAVELDGVIHDIDSSTPRDNYGLKNGATLNSQNADTNSIRARSNSVVNLSGGSVVDTGGAVGALDLNASTLTMTGTRVTSSIGRGLVLATEGGQGSTAQVTDSTIVGLTAGVSVTAESELNLINTSVTATGAGSIGLINFSGIVKAQGGSITGADKGIVIRRVTTGSEGLLVLDGTQVVGQSGSAIELTNSSTATIDIRNGATLSGGNGILVNVLDGSKATVGVTQSNLNGNLRVSDTSTGNFTFDQGSLTGDFIVDQGGTGTVALNNGSLFTGRMQNVQDARLDATSQWMMTGDSTVTKLDMGGGRVTMGGNDSFYTLNLETLTGDGTFVMGSNFATNATDFLNVNGTATGSYDLLISSSGAEPAAGVPLHVVHTGGGDAQFALVGGEVDLGAWSYGLKQEGTDWYLDPENRQISPATEAIMALAGTPTTVFYGEQAGLRSRMGELRYSEGRAAGAWVRAHSNQYNVANALSGSGYTQTQNGMSFGADMRLDNSNWLVGGLAGYSKTDLNMAYGTEGTIDSYYVGAYATWMDAQTGWFVDSVIKYNRYVNDAKVRLSDGQRAKGDYDTDGIGASVEVGKHIKLQDGWFIEPSATLAGTVIKAADYDFSNGLEAESDATHSLLARVATTVGKTIPLDEGRFVQPYVKVGMSHEFANNDRVEVNDNSFKNDLSGSRGEVGAGVALSLSKDFQVHGEFEYANGKNIEMPYSVNLGLRYLW